MHIIYINEYMYTYPVLLERPTNKIHRVSPPTYKILSSSIPLNSITSRHSMNSISQLIFKKV